MLRQVSRFPAAETDISLCPGGESGRVRPAAHCVPAYAEELFGPVAVVYRVSSEAEAVELANIVGFGLGGAVFSADEARATAVAARLEVGMANVNTPAALGPGLPFGGTKRSGFGREPGPLGIEEFVNKRLFYVERLPPLAGARPECPDEGKAVRQPHRPSLALLP
ncbi:MAG: aldehyde dehydrogenase family protein [Trebonia sp.]